MAMGDLPVSFVAHPPRDYVAAIHTKKPRPTPNNSQLFRIIFVLNFLQTSVTRVYIVSSISHSSTPVPARSPTQAKVCSCTMTTYTRRLDKFSQDTEPRLTRNT